MDGRSVRRSAHRAGGRPHLAIVAALVLAVLLTACSGAAEDPGEAAADDAPRVVQPGAPGEQTVELDPDDVEGMLAELDGHSEADVAFVQGMIGHHVQALRMTRLVPDRAQDEDLPLLARRMDIGQEGEIEVMRAWLEERDEPVPSLLQAHDHQGTGDAHGEDAEGDGSAHVMPGMLTESQLQELGAASGTEFDVLFLEYMIVHHEGALQMIDELYADLETGGRDVEVNTLADHMYADQEIEIARMQQMLADLER